MTSLPFRSAAEVTPEAIDAVLRASGALSAGRVASVVATPVGTGQMADSVRLALGYDRDDADGPASVVAKLASSDPTSRATGRTLRAYEVEVGFYRELAATVGVRVPHCHLAAIDLDTHDFVLVLEDLAPARQGDQLAGCGPDVAAAVIRQAVAFHAPRWGDPTLAGIDWFDRATPESAAFTATVVAGLFPGFLDRYGDRIPDDVVGCLERAVPLGGGWWRPSAGPRTLQHGDLRLDNLLLGDGPDDVWVVDWQTLVLGNGPVDASYFIGGNLLAPDRHAHEDELVRDYHGRLVAAGVEGYDWDACWHDYRRATWHGVFLNIAASMLVEQTERGDRMFLTDVERHTRHALDLDGFELLEAADRG